MTNEIKEKIIKFFENKKMPTELSYRLPEKQLSELLAIIDEGIEKENVDFKIIIDNLIELAESGYYGTKNRQHLLLMLYSLGAQSKVLEADFQK